MNIYLDVQSPAVKEAGKLASAYGLANHGLVNLRRAYWNLPTPALYEESIFRSEGSLSHLGPLVVDTGKHTARAAADKFVVREQSTEEKIWWGQYNRPVTSENFSALLARLQGYLQGRDVFVQDCFAGADPEYSLPIRIADLDLHRGQWCPHGLRMTLELLSEVQGDHARSLGETVSESERAARVGKELTHPLLQ